MKKKLKLTEKDEALIGISLIGFIMLVISIFFLRDTIYFTTVAILSITIMGLPFIINQYLVFKKAKEIEEYLPDFLRDVAESVRAGMPLSKAIQNAAQGTYGALTDEMKITSAQISWGVDFEEALEKFAARVKSKLVRQAILIIIESHKSGGEVADILETVSNDIKTLKSIEQERKSKLKVYLVSMYFIFFLFLGIIVALTKAFIPATPQLNQAAGLLGGHPSKLSEADFKAYFFQLTLIQAFFAGLIGGQMGEGSAISGIKHSIILIIATVLVFQILLPPVTLQQKVADIITRTPLTATKMESATNAFTIYKTTTVNDIVKEIHKRARSSERLKKYENITANQISFGEAEGCKPCEAGNIIVSNTSIVVNKPSKISYSIFIARGKYNVKIGGE